MPNKGNKCCCGEEECVCPISTRFRFATSGITGPNSAGFNTTWNFTYVPAYGACCVWIAPGGTPFHSAVLVLNHGGSCDFGGPGNPVRYLFLSHLPTGAHAHYRKVAPWECGSSNVMTLISSGPTAGWPATITVDED